MICCHLHSTAIHLFEFADVWVHRKQASSTTVLSLSCSLRQPGGLLSGVTTAHHGSWYPDWSSIPGRQACVSKAFQQHSSMLCAAVVCADVPPGWQACVSKAFKQHSSMLCAAVVCSYVPPRPGQLCSLYTQQVIGEASNMTKRPEFWYYDDRSSLSFVNCATP